MLDRLSTPAFDRGREDYHRVKDKLSNPFDSGDQYPQWRQWNDGYSFEEDADRFADPS